MRGRLARMQIEMQSRAKILFSDTLGSCCGNSMLNALNSEKRGGANVGILKLSSEILKHQQILSFSIKVSVTLPSDRRSHRSGRGECQGYATAILA